MSARKIEIGPAQSRTFPEHKVILVNGEPWGKIERRQHGRRGSSYRFAQAVSGDYIREPSYIDARGRQKYSDIVVWGDKVARSRDDRAKPLNARLIEKATELVEKGLLRAPSAVRAEIEAARVKFSDELRERDEQKRNRFLAKADECLASADPRNAIVEAMMWAQSQ